jgi:hypothetical protein
MRCRKAKFSTLNRRITRRAKQSTAYTYAGFGGPDRLAIENVTVMRYLLLTLFHLAEMPSIYFLNRESDRVWRYYCMSCTGRNASRLATGHEASTINRAVAFYRFLVGIPTDQEPPAAP